MRPRESGRALPEADAGVSAETLARRCGSGSAETIRKAFRRVPGIAPSAHRDWPRSACPLDHVIP